MTQKQLILISDSLPKTIRNRPNDFSLSIQTALRDTKLAYTSLLPGPELQLAEIAYKEKIPYIAVIPYKNYSFNWPKSFQKKYNFYLKKALKIFYIDRELNYISLTTSPDVHSKEKITLQIKWLFSRIDSSPLDTELMTYCKGLYSFKMREINKFMSQLPEESNKRFSLIQKTFLYQHLLDFEEKQSNSCPF